MAIRGNMILLDQTVEGAGPWIRLDSRYDIDNTRPLHGSVVTGDSIIIQGILRDDKGIDTGWMQNIRADDISNLATYTANFNDILNGSWSYIRAVKTGTAGRAKVQGTV